MRLKIEIKNYWHPGTGRGQGSRLDATTHRNTQGIPCLPGRTIKGLVRDAVQRWEEFGGYAPIPTGSPSITAQLFGPQSDDSNATWPGLLRFTDGELPKADVQYLAKNNSLLAGLYRHHFATAIDHATGTSIDTSLRGIELVIPLTLWATIDLVPDAKYRDLQTTWAELVKQALPLIQAVGAHRSRGLGRAVVTLEN